MKKNNTEFTRFKRLVKKMESDKEKSFERQKKERLKDK